MKFYIKLVPADPFKLFLYSVLLHASIVHCTKTSKPANNNDNNNDNNNNNKNNSNKHRNINHNYNEYQTDFNTIVIRKSKENSEISNNFNNDNKNNNDKSEVQNDRSECPKDCVCSPTQRSHLRITCIWPSISGPEFFEAFPHTRTRSLKIRCTQPDLVSIMPSGTFAAFGTSLHHLAIHDCHLDGGKLVANQFRGLTHLRTFKMSIGDTDNDLSSFRHFDMHYDANSNNGDTSENDKYISQPLKQPKSGSTGLTLEPSCFNGCKRLEKLSLPRLEITSVPDNELCGLQELKMLNLTGNYIASLKHLGGIGSCSLQLVMLDVSDNRLPDIPPGTLNGLKHLHFLHLDNNNITHIEPDSFRKLRSLRVLTMRSNSLRTFEVALPTALKALRSLDLSNNSLVEIPNALCHSESLVRLNLSHNKINQLPKVTSTRLSLKLPLLQVLDLKSNLITTVNTQEIAKLASLKHLDLANNAIANLSRDAITAMPKLHHLNLAHNLLTDLSNESFHRLPALSDLNLEDNRLTRLTDNFFNAMPQIKRLHLGSNSLHSVPTALQALYFLNWLNLSNNSIAQPTNLLFDRLHNLVHIDLSHNRLPEIRRQFLENVPKMDSLNLAHNLIEDIDANAFHGSNNLRSLQLEGNQLQQLKGFASNLPRLRLLNISQNQLSQLDYSMIPVSLRSLDVSQNRLNRLTNFLTWNVSVESLNLSHNHIVSLPERILPPSLVEADLSHNRLTLLPEGLVSRLTRLRRLDLSSNQLQEANESSILLKTTPDSTQEHAYELSLVGNPLLCSCNMEWVTGLLPGTLGDSQISTELSRKTSGSTRLPKLADISALACSPIHGSTMASPSPTGVLSYNRIPTGIIPFSRLKSSDLLCPYDEICAEGCVCCLFDSCDCKSECPPGCACYRDAAYATNVVRCSNNPLIAGDSVDSGAPFSLRAVPMYATEIFLDGVQLPALTRHSFLGRFRLRSLHLNASGIERIEPSAFIGLNSLRYLDLSNNKLEILTGSEFKKVPRLATLDLSNNVIRHIEPSGFNTIQDSLQDLKLHNNRLRLMPSAIRSLASEKKLTTLTLGGNPWACDCETDTKKYSHGELIQTWLPTHTSLVRDNQALYCFENLTISSDLSKTNTDSSSEQTAKPKSASDQTGTIGESVDFRTILKLLPPTAPNTSVVKVNFWAFLSDIVPQFCSDGENSPNTQSNSGSGSETSDISRYSMILIGSLVCTLGLALFAAIFLLLWRYKGKVPPEKNAALKQSLLGVVRRRSSKSRISSATSSGGGSGHSTLPPLPGLDIPSPRRGGDYYSSSGGGASSSSPLLQYDAFVAYSREETEFVSLGLTSRLEQELPYYELCLLHRDVPSSGGGDIGHERHMINDELIDVMERSQRIILVLSEAFLRLEWRLVQIRTALQCVLKDSRVRRLIVILVGDVPLAEIDPMLGHYIRTNVCLQYDESDIFWQKLREALPDKVLSSPLNRTSSTELYGTIIPSDFV